MTETTPKTAAELNEMQADLDRQKATLSLTKIDQALEAMDAHETDELISVLSEISATLPDGSARSQLQNTVSVLSGSKMILLAERDRNERTLAPVPQFTQSNLPPAE